MQYNAPDLFEVHVIWRASDDEFRRGYNLLINEVETNPDIHEAYFHEETNLRENLLDLIKSFRYNQKRLLLFNTDDGLYHTNIRNQLGPEPYKVIDWVLRNKEFSGFSLRLGKNSVVENHVTGETCKRWDWAEFTLDGIKVLNWNSKAHPPNSNPGYALSVDCVCFRTDMILGLMKKCNWDTPNSLECALSQFSHGAEIPDFMASPTHSIFCCSPLNNVSGWSAPHGKFHPYSVKDLNDRYLNGEVIDFKSLDLSNIVGIHQEIAPVFRSLL
jgi:hypothetical protein